MIVNNKNLFLKEETELRKKENYVYIKNLISRKNFFSV